MESLSVLFIFVLGVLPHVTAFLAGFFLYKAAKESVAGKMPSAPAAIGRALGIAVLGQLLGFYLLWYISTFLLSAIGMSLKDPNISVLHGPIGIVFAVLAGYLSVRTYEDTKAMNVKIVAGIGLLPQGLITMFNFNEGISPALPLWLFIPSVFLGAYIFNRWSESQIPTQTSIVKAEEIKASD